MKSFVIQPNVQSMTTAAPAIHVLATSKNIVSQQISVNQKMNDVNKKKPYAMLKKNNCERNALIENGLIKNGRKQKSDDKSSRKMKNDVPFMSAHL